MEKVRQYAMLMRPKHYLKNVLVFMPLIFSGHLLSLPYALKALAAFAAFSMAASMVYIINDLKDKQLDQIHPKKKNRPLASGAVTTHEAISLLVLLGVLVIAFQLFAHVSVLGMILLAVYILMNVAYSFGLKNIPIVDVTILSFGFLIRVLYGGEAVGVVVSQWLYLTILTLSFYLGFGKRRNEVRVNGSTTRKVNKFYTQEFLDKNMYVCLGLTIVYYSLWTVDPIQSHKHVFWTVPLIIVIVMAYSLAVERQDSDGDPVDVLLGDKLLASLVLLYGILMLGLMYFGA